MEPSELDGWAAHASAALGVNLDANDIGVILDLARDAAHGIARPAAPLTAYIAGLAVGRGRVLSDVIDELAVAIETHGR